MARKNTLYFVVLIIGVLLVTDIVLTSRNNAIIRHNKLLQAKTERINLYYDHVGKMLIQALDLGLRGYALVPEENLARPMNHAKLWMDSIFSNIRAPLDSMHYDLAELDELQDSVEAYRDYCFRLKQLVHENKREEFTALFRKDRGGRLWWQYELCEKSINAFTGKIHEVAEARYEEALYSNYALQILLFVICFPTLLYTAYQTQRTFLLNEKLHHAEEERNRLLQQQNTILEREVANRTQDLATQNEEISAQSEELAAQRDLLKQQNDQLMDAQRIIEAQNRNIQGKNKDLEDEVRVRTLELQNTNHELIDHNNQLEQFAFISAHNLRAPLARILGLANLTRLTSDQKEKEMLLGSIVSSAKDLDSVIKDLSTILEIRKHTSRLTEIDLETTLARVLKSLQKELEETHALVTNEGGNNAVIYAVGPYVESILYNLISNALKYRDPLRGLHINISIREAEEYLVLSVSDNGLGIDLTRFRRDIFGLYKRFHLHVEGKGLGLYLVRTQMAALDGKVEIESEPGTGTTFLLYFKRSRPQ